MKVFWPRRSNAKGFAIHNVASKFTENISSDSSNENQKKILNSYHLKLALKFH